MTRVRELSCAIAGARRGSHPQTGAAVEIPAKRLLYENSENAPSHAMGLNPASPWGVQRGRRSPSGHGWGACSTREGEACGVCFGVSGLCW